MAEGAPVITIQEDLVMMGVRECYAKTEGNVLGSLFKPHPLSERTKENMRLLQLAYYNRLTKQNLTWDTASAKMTVPADDGTDREVPVVAVNQEARSEAKEMVKDFCAGVIREAQGETKEDAFNHPGKFQQIARRLFGHHNGPSGK